MRKDPLQAAWGRPIGNAYIETDQTGYSYKDEELEEGRRRRRIEDIREASRLEREVLGEVWD